MSETNENLQNSGSGFTEDTSSDGFRRFSIDDLIYLMARLRTPGTGCPCAIESGDHDHLKEELGDLLFQVIFYSRLAEEESRYDFSAVVHHLTGKLIRRHPHVFPDGTLESSVKSGTDSADDGAIKSNWDAIKKAERVAKGKLGVLDDVPVSFPGMTRALKLQKRAAKAGFDWNLVGDVLAKVDEELEEFKQALILGEKEAIADELGDVFFTLVSVARHCDLDPEAVVRGANQKFTRRFNYIEQKANASQSDLSSMESEEMERLWGEAKEEGL